MPSAEPRSVDELAMTYEAFLIHLEPKTLAVLERIIWDQHWPTHDDFVVETELKNLANEIRARLEKLTNGIVEVKVEQEPDWLQC